MEQNIHVPLTIIESPYRDFGVPLVKYLKHRREEHGSEVVTVYLPQYIVGHWWETLLHNHRARRLAKQLMLCHGVTVALVPWLLDSSSLIYGRRSRPLPGQDRRGEPVRPVARRPLAPASKAHSRIHIHPTPITIGQPEDPNGETTGQTPVAQSPTVPAQGETAQKKVPAKAKR